MPKEARCIINRYASSFRAAKLSGSLQHERGADRTGEDDTETRRESDGAREDCVFDERASTVPSLALGMAWHGMNEWGRLIEC